MDSEQSVPKNPAGDGRGHGNMGTRQEQRFGGWQCVHVGGKEDYTSEYNGGCWVACLTWLAVAEARDAAALAVAAVEAEVGVAAAAVNAGEAHLAAALQELHAVQQLVAGRSRAVAGTVASARRAAMV